MALHFLFRANAIDFSRPADDNFVGNASNLTINSGPVADPVGEAKNNVRFAVTGSAGQGDFETVMFTLRTICTFNFRPRESGRLTTSTFFKASGAFALSAREKEWWDVFDPNGGVASFGVSVKMDTRVRAANGATVLATTASNSIAMPGAAIQAGNVAVTDEGVVLAEFGDFIRSQAFATIVTPTDRVRVRAIYTVQAIVIDRATFSLDFNASDAGDGLNVPMAVMRTD